jgi:1-acyl-sn-glycerol-3-phosphate acyltransferase
MLDLARIERIRLSPRSRYQRVVAWIFLMLSYNFPRRTRIQFEGFDNVPDHPIIFAMNHTDRYNYWPLQYRLYRQKRRFTATWVKGKYYKSWWIGKFMEKTNNIPTVSRGYLIAEDFLSTLQRRPTNVEYAALRAWVDRGEVPAEGAIPDDILSRPRDMLGRTFDPENEDYQTALNALFRRMMSKFVSLNVDSFEKGLDLLVFPQGTRSIRLSKGHIGLGQIALKLKRTIVPVGCNGSDLCHPGASPWARGGRIVYRFGKPITYDDMAPFHIDTDYEPFTKAAETEHRDRFQGLVDVVMDRINGLLDERHQFSCTGESDGVIGANRFV